MVEQGVVSPSWLTIIEPKMRRCKKQTDRYLTFNDVGQAGTHNKILRDEELGFRKTSTTNGDDSQLWTAFISHV